MFHDHPFQKSLTHTRLFKSPRFHAACCHLSSWDEKRWLGVAEDSSGCGGLRRSKASYCPFGAGVLRMNDGEVRWPRGHSATYMTERFILHRRSRRRSIRRSLWQSCCATHVLCRSKKNAGKESLFRPGRSREKRSLPFSVRTPSESTRSEVADLVYHVVTNFLPIMAGVGNITRFCCISHPSSKTTKQSNPAL
jgi:hypothetical protein